MILDAIRKRWPCIKHLFADGAYDRRAFMDEAAMREFVIEVIKRLVGHKAFEVLPRRWVVERTFAWIFKNRRLVRDYEQLTAVAETLITIAASVTLLRRWA